MVIKTNCEKKKKLLQVFEGFAIFIIVHAIGRHYIYPQLVEYYPYVPRVTMALLSSSAISPVFAIFYLAFRSRHFPECFVDKKNIFLVVVAGAMALWLLFFAELLFFNKSTIIVRAILKTSESTYYKFNFFLYVFWTPLIEETLFRGYLWAAE